MGRSEVMIRIDKLLADCGYGSRKQVKEMLKKGRVAIDGKVITDSGQKIDPKHHGVTVDGESVKYERFHYYMMNKPPNIVSATEDLRERTVVDLLPKERRKGVFPVGRLDKDTTGLLLLTNDGELAHRLLSPNKHVMKTYRATLDAPVGEKEIRLFSEGLVVDDEFTALPAKLEILEGTNEPAVLVSICEGKFHQVKRMFAAVGRKVIHLKRISMGNLMLDPALSEGEYRELSENEIKTIG